MKEQVLIRFNRLRSALLVVSLVSPAVLAQEILKPEGLLLRGFESQASVNRRGYAAVENGVQTTVRVDAAEQISATRSKEVIKPLIEWYRARDQKYLAYSVFANPTSPYLGNPDNLDLYIMNVEGERTNDLNPNHVDVLAATVASAKAYVDAGVDGIEYDVDGWAGGMGSFDPATLASFKYWLTETKGYTNEQLASIFGTPFDLENFDYRTFLRDKDVSSSDYYAGDTNQSAHFRLWRAFNNVQERETTQSLIDQVNNYAQETIGRKIEFYFNRYGFFNTPARRWNSIDVDSGSLGETWFEGVTWNYERGHTLEPLYRAALHTFDKRYESWNQPPTATDAVQSVYLASTIANSGVADWRDDYPNTANVARFAYRFQGQLDQIPSSEVAVFYPQATVDHNLPVQEGNDPLIGGQHYWYLGLGYLLADLNLNYDVLFAGDGLALEDQFSAPSVASYGAVLAAETHQATQRQFDALLSYVNEGGLLIVMGANVLRYDELGTDRSNERGSGSLDYDEIFGSVGETAIGAGKIRVVSLGAIASQSYSFRVDQSSIDIGSIRSSLSAALPDSLKNVEVTGGDRLRVLTYRDKDDGSLILHVINHGFSDDGESLASQTNVSLSVVIPEDVPDAEIAQFVDIETGMVQTLALEAGANGRASLALPSVTTWAMIRIGSALEDPGMPNILPIAELSELGSNQVYKNAASRKLDFQAADDAGLESVTLWYQKLDTNSGIWSEWTEGDDLALNGAKRVKPGAESEDLSVDFASLGEGLYRAQLIATDTEGLESSLLGTGGYDTLVGYDAYAPDFSEVDVTVTAGPENGAVISEPSDVTLSIANVIDAVSGVFQINSKFSSASFDSEPEDGEPYTEPYNRTFSGPEAGEYGVYTVAARAQDNAGNWSAWKALYSYTYGLPPSISATGGLVTSSEGARELTSGETTVALGDSVDIELTVLNTLGELTIVWYKDGAVLEGRSERRLELGTVDLEDAGTYYATLTNAAGSVESERYVLTVSTPLAITEFSREPSDGQVEEGGSFTLSVVAVGTGELTYQWEEQILQNDWVVIDGATESTYSVANASKNEHQGNYRVTVSDNSGSVTSDRTLHIDVVPSGGGAGEDSDGDGISNGVDNCPNNANELQADLDDDGEGDACDLDIDGDGYSNTDEGLAGTDPKDQTSFPESSTGEDRDNDGVVDALDLYPEDATKSANTPFYFTFDGVIDVVSDSTEGKTPHQVRSGEAYRYTIVVDNHDGAASAQTWTRADIEFLILTLNNDEDAAVLVDVANIRTPFGFGSSLSGQSLTLESDQAGKLTKTWNDAIFIGVSDDIRLDWYQTFGWLDSEIGVAQRLQARTDSVAEGAGLYSDQSGFAFSGVDHSSRIEVGSEWSAASEASCGGLILETQDEVNAVLSNVCTRIAGDLIIQGTEIQDLRPLRVIRTIDGELIIGNETTMPTLDGLQGLSHVNGAEVIDSDGDYHPDFMDAFPDDPAAAFDSDQDGFPNDWLPGYFSSALDPELVADADDDDDGIIDYADEFPLDPKESADLDGDGIGDEADTDDDGDLIGDDVDNCPSVNNPDQLDFDLDSEGDACDLDDDNDGFSDEEETLTGSDPFDNQVCPETCFNFDIDGDGDAKALTDGLLVIRHLFGFSGSALIANATSVDSVRSSAESVEAYLSSAADQLDVDGDGSKKALTDGLLVIRYLFGFTGEALISGAIGTSAERTTAAEIEAYIDARLPAQ
jgi:predicted RNA-binding protein with TRAM domain